MFSGSANENDVAGGIQTPESLQISSKPIAPFQVVKQSPHTISYD